MGKGQEALPSHLLLARHAPHFSASHTSPLCLPLSHIHVPCRLQNKQTLLNTHLQQTKEVCGQTAAQACTIWLHLKLFHYSVFNQHRVPLGANIPQERSGIKLHVDCLKERGNSDFIKMYKMILKAPQN